MTTLNGTHTNANSAEGIALTSSNINKDKEDVIMLANHTPYTVQPKDCLWDLASRFYRNPTLWPLIFEYNNLPHIVKQTGTRILDPDLILIGQALMIPNAKLAERYGTQGLTNVTNHIRKARQTHREKGPNQQRQIQQLQQSQPQPTSGEAMGRRQARHIAAPAYEFDLGKTTLAATQGPGFRLNASLSGKLLIQDTRPAAIHLTANGLKGFQAKSKLDSETLAGKLISDLKFDVDLKSRTVKLTGGLASQSTIKGAPVVKMNASVNALGQPTLSGNVTYEIVKGELPHHLVAGEKVTFEIEMLFDQRQSAGSEENIIEDLAKSIGGISLGIGAIAIIAATIYEDIITAGVGTWNDAASFAIATAMLVSARQLILTYGRQALNKSLHWLTITATTMLAAPLQAAKATGLLDDK